MYKCELKKEFYKISYKFRNILLLIVIFLTIILAFDLSLYFLVLWIIFALVWLAFPAWLNLYFRYIGWWVSRRCGIIIKWISSGWRRALLLLAGIASMLFIRRIIIRIPDAFQGGEANFSAAYFWTMINKNWTEILMPDFWMKVFAISALLFVVFWAYQSRTRIVLLSFTNQTGDDKLNSSASGISAILMNELTRLVNLCKMVDDTDPYTPSTQGTGNVNEDSSKSINPNISVSGVGETLKSVVTSDSKVKLGFLEVPIGAIMGILGTTVEGPKLNGSLLKEGSCLVLLANMSGGGIKGDWRISSSDLSGQDISTADQVAGLTRQLAHRIFTDLEKEHLGTPRWKAVCHYTEGLRAYRDTLRNNRNNHSLLRRAEREFLLALGEDKEFLYCLYNLGIVYQALRQPESAFSVLKKSADPHLSRAYLSKVYYALARNHSWIQATRAKYADYRLTIQLCDKAVSLSPDDARAWDLIGMIKKVKNKKEKELAKNQVLEVALEAKKEKDIWKEEIIPVREIATALAWRRICRCAFCGLDDKAAMKIAITCVRNLAVAHAQFANSGKPFFHQSIYLSPHDADLYFELAKTQNYIENWKEAAAAFEDALRIEQKPEYWSGLALAYSGQYESSLAWKNILPPVLWPYIYREKNDPIQFALYACRHALDYASGASKGTLRELNEALIKILNSIGKQSEKRFFENEADHQIRLERLKRDVEGLGSYFLQISLYLERLYVNENDMRSVQQLRDDMSKIAELFPIMAGSIKLLSDSDRKKDESDESYISRLRLLKKDYSEWDSSCTLIYTRLLSLNVANAEELMEAIKKLEGDHPLEIANQDLHGRLASELLSPPREKLGQSLYHAQRSVTLSPVDSINRSRIAEIYGSYGSYEEASDQLEIGFSLEPENPDFLLKSATLQSGFNPGRKKPEESKKALAKYIENLIRSLELSQSKLLDNEEKGEEEIRSRRRTHYYLARAYQELNEHEKAIHNYIIAKNLIPKTNRSYLIPVFDLGATYLDNKSYNECEELYRKLIEEIEEIIKKIPPLRWGEIPGKDSEKLKAYLEKNFDIRGIIDKNFEEIEKGRTIQISTETNCLFLCLNQEESWATLVIDDGRIDKLKAAKYNSEVNIYLPIEFNASSELADSEFGYNDVTLGFLMGLACLNLAFCYSKRDMNLTDALKLVEKANSYIIYLQNTERKHQSEERYAHHKGWILYKQAKLGDGVSDMKAAIDCLKQAVCMKADPDYYLHLALALEHKLDTEGGDLQKTETGKNEMKCNLVLALACCDHAIDLDMQNELTEQATNLKKRLEDLKRNSLNKPDAKKAKESAEQSKGYA